MNSEVRSFDRIADTYDETRGGEERGHRYAVEFEPLFAGPGRTLEVGIGTGLVANALRQTGRPVFGVDIAPLMLERARGRIGPVVAVGNAEVLPILDSSFSNAYSVWVLHLVDVASVLREIARILRPGGRYVVSSSSPPKPNPIQAIVGEMFRGLSDAPRRDAPDTVEALAKAAGLRPIARLEASPQIHVQTPYQAAKLIEVRSYAALWDLDDDTWDRLCAPAITALRALPNPDRPIEHETRAPILVFER